MPNIHEIGRGLDLTLKRNAEIVSQARTKQSQTPIVFENQKFSFPTEVSLAKGPHTPKKLKRPEGYPDSYL